MESQDPEQGYVYGSSSNVKSCSERRILFYLNFLAHVIMLCHHIFTNIYAMLFFIKIHDHKIDKVREIFVFFPCFATNWNLFFQFMFLCCALAHDVLEWGGKQDSARGKKIRYYRDVIFSGMVVPITMFVVVMFWSLYTIDRELVFPEVFDNIVPRWFNHCVHTNILVLVAAETLLQPRRKPADLRAERICYVTISVLYAVVYYSIYFFGNRWLYKVFGLLTWWQVVLFQLLIWGSTHVFYVMQFPINRLIHGSEPEDEKVVENHQKEVEKEVETETKEEVEKSLANGIQAKGEFRNAPFADKSWSLKYRSIRDQFENSRL